ERVVMPGGLRWRFQPTVKLQDELRRFTIADLSVFGQNRLEYPKDFLNPTSVLFFLPRDRVVGLPLGRGDPARRGCPAKSNCVLVGDLTVEVPRGGVVVGRRFASLELLKRRDDQVRDAANLVPLGAPDHFLEHSFDVRNIEVVLKSFEGDVAACEKVTCLVQPEEENLCELHGTPVSCP